MVVEVGFEVRVGLLGRANEGTGAVLIKRTSSVIYYRPGEGGALSIRAPTEKTIQQLAHIISEKHVMTCTVCSTRCPCAVQSDPNMIKPRQDPSLKVKRSYSPTS